MSVSSARQGKTKFKVVLLGDQSVGKSSIITRFMHDTFEEIYQVQATIGIDFLVKNIEHSGLVYRLQVWDTAGQQRFKSLIPSYLKDSHCAMIVYDVLNQESMHALARWLQLYEMHKDPGSVVIFVGNKIDLGEGILQEGERIAKELKLKHFQVSAKSGKGVSQLFRGAIDIINESIKAHSFMEMLNANSEAGGDDKFIPKSLMPMSTLTSSEMTWNSIHGMDTVQAITIHAQEIQKKSKRRLCCSQ